MTGNQRRILEGILRGRSLEHLLAETGITRRTWVCWTASQEFRTAVAEGIARKEIEEVFDALTLNRRAYDRMLQALEDRSGDPPDGEGPAAKRGGDGLDEKSARIHLSIIEAMAKRLCELGPRLCPPGRERDDSLHGIRPEVYDALAKHFERIQRGTPGD